MDTGIGIEREKQATIFAAFTQGDSSMNRRFGGSGLGLAISSRLVQMMAGKIWVESEPGRGSAFHFTARFGSVQPVSRQLTLSSAGQITHTPDARGKRPLRVLLTEDNPINQKLAARLLEREGHTVVLAETGRRALELLLSGSFDLVLMDIQMPDMNGFDTTAEIRRREQGSGRHLPIIATTAHAMVGDRERCLSSGMDWYVAKPIRKDDLFAAIERVVVRPAESVAC